MRSVRSVRTRCPVARGRNTGFQKPFGRFGDGPPARDKSECTHTGPGPGLSSRSRQLARLLAGWLGSRSVSSRPECALPAPTFPCRHVFCVFRLSCHSCRSTDELQNPSTGRAERLSYKEPRVRPQNLDLGAFPVRWHSLQRAHRWRGVPESPGAPLGPWGTSLAARPRLRSPAFVLIHSIIY